MRKYVQQQVLELLSTVWEGVEYAVSQDAAQSAAEVLQDCCMAVQAVDDTLKSGLSDERYCFYKRINDRLLELIGYLLSGSLNNESVTAVLQHLENQLNLIYGELVNEQEVKLEIVFLPYKSSMWDSLESIWRAADADPRCEAYVVPIPYYEINADLNVNEFRYEGADYPADVPIMDFRSYDIRERQPDVIYIHNPFDQFNRVTSVHPDYYSSALRPYTDKLVYVPYYVLGGGVPETIKHTLAVYEHMDYMVVQSETYKEHYKQTLPEHKLLAMGSPKIDRVVHLENNKPPMPLEWGDRIGDKKVVMYNVSIAGLLENNEQALKKMAYVFSCFKDRDDVVLLWRPHPLIEATLKSMRPDLYDDFVKLKEDFIANQWGIYDTSPDVSTAVAWSDAYVGEESSSVVHLFGVVGKPILVTNMEIDHVVKEEHEARIMFYACHYEDDTIWFVEDKCAFIGKINLLSGSVEVIAEIPVNESGNLQYGAIVKVGDQLIMPPYNASFIVQYDLKSGEFKRIPLPDAKMSNFSSVARDHNRIFMIPEAYPTIMEFNLSTDSFIYHDWVDSVSQAGTAALLYHGTATRDNSIMRVYGKTNKVLEFDLNTGEYKTHTVGREGMTYLSIAFDGTDYWLIPDEGDTIVRWHYDTGAVIYYNDYPEGFVGLTRGFYEIISCNGFMLAFPKEANMIIRIDIETGKMSEYKLHPSVEPRPAIGFEGNNNNYAFVQKVDENRVIALRYCDNSLLVIDIESNEHRLIPSKWNQSDTERYRRAGTPFHKLHDNMPFASYEGEWIFLREFIDQYVTSIASFDRRMQIGAYSAVINNIDGTCGIRIHQKIKGAIVGS